VGGRKREREKEKGGDIRCNDKSEREKRESDIGEEERERELLERAVRTCV